MMTVDFSENYIKKSFPYLFYFQKRIFMFVYYDYKTKSLLNILSSTASLSSLEYVITVSLPPSACLMEKPGDNYPDTEG